MLFETLDLRNEIRIGRIHLWVVVFLSIGRKAQTNDKKMLIIKII